MQQQPTTRTRIPLASIDRAGRSREDYGDVAELAESIATFGLIQPVVVTPTDPPKLLVGGRRCAAHDLLGWPEIDVIYRECVTGLELLELELEENIRRKDINWIEYVKSVRRIHVIKSNLSAKDGELWTQQRTAIALGQTQGTISMALKVAEELERNPESPCAKADGWYDAFKMLVSAKATAAQEALRLATQTASPGQPSAPTPTPNAESVLATNSNAEGEAASAGGPSEPVVVNLANMVMLQPREGDGFSVLKQLPAESIDAIITDPPYGIDMANLQQTQALMDVSSTAAEHDVDENVELLRRFLPEAFRVLRDKTFCVLWCDLDWWDYLLDLAAQAGFSAQRWPLIWTKPHAMNQAAGYNFTKDFEVALVLRKGNATLVKPQSTSIKFTSSREEDNAFLHPFAKPLNLWQWVLEATTLPGHVVLDPFAGCGSASCAALSCESGPRKIRAIELVPAHHSEMLTNIAKTLTTVHKTKTLSYVHDPATSTFFGVRA